MPWHPLDWLRERLPGARERRWVAAVRQDFRFLADLGIVETRVRWYVTGPNIEFEGGGNGLSLSWESDGIHVLSGAAWRSGSRETEVMVEQLIRAHDPDAVLPPHPIEEIAVALEATHLLAAQLAVILPAFYAGTLALPGPVRPRS